MESPRPRRPYDAAGRRAAAERRRERVLDEAARLFAADGWTATTLARVAEAAGVSTELVTTAYGTKAGLLVAAVERVVGRWHAGVEHDVDEVRRVSGLSQARRLDAVVDGACAVLPVLAPLAAVVDRAADHDPQARATVRAARARHAETSRLVASLLATGPVPPDAADEVYALLLIENYRALVEERGWPVERYAAWLRRTLLAAVAPVAPVAPAAPAAVLDAPAGIE